MPLLPAPRGASAAPLPPRAVTARACLWAGAPLALLTLLASSQSVKDPGARATLIAAGFLAALALLYVSFRVPVDHEPAALPNAGAAAGRGGQWDWTDVLAFLPAAAAAAFFTVSLLVGVTQVADQSLQPSARTAVEAFAGQAATYAAALAALLVLLGLRRGLRLADLGWRRPRPLGSLGWWPWLVISLVAAVAAVYVADWLASFATQVLPNSPNTQCTTVRDQYGGYLAVAIPLVCLIAPLSEETIFRGFMYGWLRRHLPVLPAVAVSAAVFSAAHLVLVLALPLFAVGVVLALLYEYSGSLLPGAIVHGLFNLVGIVSLLGTSTSC
ncbi:MAG TPA: CPBP family intramembrane glutamic endopeptidase [Candidatus Dormibacteraeota bacterium]|nr:CPBP family intramembrane glutamic endopeptidase [Candidatus Dormibacteraeota bacterium]